MNMKNYDQALELFDRVIEKEPANVGAISKRGVLFIKMRDYEKSWADLKKCLVLDPCNEQIENHA